MLQIQAIGIELLDATSRHHDAGRVGVLDDIQRFDEGLAEILL